MSPPLSNGGTEAIKALNVIHPTPPPVISDWLWRSNTTMHCSTRDEYSTISYDGRHGSRAGVGPKFTGREEQRLASFTHLRFSQDVLLLRTFFELENQNKVKVAHLEISRCLNEGLPSVSANWSASCGFSTIFVRFDLGKGEGK